MTILNATEGGEAPAKVRRRKKLIIAKDVVTREPKWLWFPYIPLAAATLLFGPGGAGKSHISDDIAAAVSIGRRLPGQKNTRKARKVLIMSAEDEFETVLVPRLIRQGADLANIAFPPEPFTLDEAGLRLMEAYREEFGADLVIIDPIVHYIGGKVDMTQSNEVREVMGGLHQSAIHSQSAILVVGHSRKGDVGEDFEKAMGSADFSNAVRSGLFTTKASDGTRIMRHVKHNYSPQGPTLSYSFEDETFRWDGEVTDTSDIKQAGRPNKQRQQAQSFLKAFLAHGAVAAKEIEAAATDEGISLKTLQRAKVGIAESFMVYEAGKPVWYWRLENDTTEVSGLGAGRPVEAGNPTTDTREEYPGETAGTGTAVPGLGGSRRALAKEQAREIAKAWNAQRRSRGEGPGVTDERI